VKADLAFRLDGLGRVPNQGTFRTAVTYTHDGQIASRTYPGSNTYGYSETITYSHDPRTGLTDTVTSNTAGQIMACPESTFLLRFGTVSSFV